MISSEIALTLVVAVLATSCVGVEEIHVQSQFPPLLIQDAPKGGAHPIGGPAYHFVLTANEILAPLHARFVFHVSGDIHPADRGRVEPRIVDLKKFQNLHEAVKAGAIQAGIGLSNMNGFPFGELLVTGLPFGMEPDEFAAYLYEGGGLELQQQIYDEKFDEEIVVIPIAITATQGGGWFSEPLPDPDTRDDLTAEEAMAELCRRPIIVRWPEPGSKIWQRAAKNVGVRTGLIGAKTRSDVDRVEHLTFGGFVFGGLPHRFLLLDEIDAYELNLPYTDVMMIKLVQGQWNKSNSEADLRPVVRKAPFFYGSTWHQPLSYVELLFNRTYWEQMTHEQRNAIRLAAKAATLANLTISLDRQDEGIALLEKAGAVVLRWPEGLLQVLRTASEEYLDERAVSLATAGDDSYRRVLEHQRDYMIRHRIFWDFGDINQGAVDLPTSPRQ